MGTYAKKTCHKCRITRTVNLMVAKNVRVKSGNIGWGLSFNPNRKKSARIQLPRNRYSNQKKLREQRALNSFSSDNRFFLLLLMEYEMPFIGKRFTALEPPK